MSFLNGLFTEFDELVEQHGIYKVLLFAVDMLRVAANTPLPIGDGHEPVRLRVVRQDAPRITPHSLLLLRTLPYVWYPLWPGHQWGGGAQDATLLPFWGYCKHGLPHGIDWAAWLHSGQRIHLGGPGQQWAA
ncbi:hypothetical protein HaLaN_00118, partial [Haematococcus lacustris]